MKKFLSIFSAIALFVCMSVFPVKTEVSAAENAAEYFSACDNAADDSGTAVSVSSTSVSQFLTNNYATYYFSNLTENFGRNLKGSCTYVALGMLLSFYDTYWDDSIIPESYDMITLTDGSSDLLSQESPGVYAEAEYNLNKKISTEDYYTAIEQYSAYCFHLKLIQMGQEEYGLYDFSDAENPCSLNRTGLLQVMNYYLYSYMDFSSSEIQISSVTTNVRAYTIEKIKQGIPVLLRMGKTGESIGHAMIAYDYDETNDRIYVHNGYSDEDNRILYIGHSDCSYDLYWDATILTINTNHSCSNNFKYTSGGSTTSYCPCRLGIHPAHSHSYTGECVYYSDSGHKVYCSTCNSSYTIKAHTFVQSGIWSICSGCGYGKSNAGSIEPWKHEESVA